MKTTTTKQNIRKTKHTCEYDLRISFADNFCRFWCVCVCVRRQIKFARIEFGNCAGKFKINMCKYKHMSDKWWSKCLMSSRKRRRTPNTAQSMAFNRYWLLLFQSSEAHMCEYCKQLSVCMLCHLFRFSCWFCCCFFFSLRWIVKFWFDFRLRDAQPIIYNNTVVTIIFYQIFNYQFKTKTKTNI